MPNHCSNCLYLRGPVEIIERMLHETSDLDFEKVIPYPEGQAWNQAWCVENWGTKWSDEEYFYKKRTEDGYRCHLLTAWDPPIPIINRLSEMYPSVFFDLRYGDDALGFGGRYVVKAGTVLAQEIEDYPAEEPSNMAGSCDDR